MRKQLEITIDDLFLETFPITPISLYCKNAYILEHPDVLRTKQVYSVLVLTARWLCLGTAVW